MAADQIVLAAIAGAHGIRGEVRLKLFTDDAQSLARHARFDAGGRALVLAAIFAAAALVMLWIQPEAFGIGPSKAIQNTKAAATAPTRPAPANDLAPPANPADKPAPSTSGSPTPSAPR